MPYTFEQFLNVRSALRPSFSPDGDRIAFLTDISGLPQLWSVPAAGGAPRQLTDYAERIIDARYAPAGGNILFSMDQGGDERGQLYLLDDATAAVTALTSDPEVIHTFGAWSPDGNAVAYVSNRRHRAFFDVYVRDLDAAEARLVWQQDGSNGVVAWSPDGRYLLVSQAATSLYNELFLLDITTGDATQLTRGTGDAAYASPQWSPDGKKVYLLTNQDREFLALASMDPATGAIATLHAPDWDVEMLACSAGGRIAYVTNVDGYSELAALDAADAAPRPVDALPRGVVTSLAWSADGARLAAAVSSETRPSDVWLVDAASLDTRQLTHSHLGGLGDDAFTPSTLVHYPTFDGQNVPSFFHLPPGAEKTGDLPVLVYVHGGPEAQSRPGFSPIVQYFAHRGYAVLVTNVRGSTGYGRTYVHQDDVEKRMDAVRDLKHAVDWLVDSGYSRTDRIAVMGGSYGGFMTLAAVTTYPDLWGAAVELFGIANFHTFMENTGPWRRKLRATEYGDADRDADLLREISPIHRVDQIRAPLMALHGARDPRVPIGETEQIVAALQERGQAVEYVRFENEGHGFVKYDNRVRAYTAIADFLDRYIMAGG